MLGVVATNSHKKKITMLSTNQKICVLGDCAVGKSSLVIRFCSNYFISSYDPTIEDVYRKQTTVDGVPCLVEVLDTTGTNTFIAQKDQWIRESEGLLLVYSLTSRSSFDQVQSIFRHVEKLKSFPFSTILVANKCDLDGEREVSFKEGQKLAKQIGASFLETSALNGQKVDAFCELVRLNRKISSTIMSGEKSLKRCSKKCSIL